MASAPSGWLSRVGEPRSLFDRLHFVGATLGLLVVIHLFIMVDRGFDRGCFGFSAPTPTVECEIVTMSGAGSLMGVSSTWWGLGYYGLLLVLGLLAGPLAGSLTQSRGRSWRLVRAALLTVGLLYSGWLIYLQATDIGAFCKLCLMSAAVTLFLFLLVVASLRGGKPSSHSPAMPDSRFYGAVALVAVVLVVADLSYFSGLDVATAAPQETEAVGSDVAAQPSAPIQPSPLPVAPSTAVCSYDEAVPAVADYASLVQLGDPYLGSASAKVVVMEFIDPNCNHCASMHPMMKRIAVSHGERAKIYMVPFMLWPEISLLPIEALYVAAQDGKFYEMLDEQFKAQGPNGYTPAQLRQMAETIGLDGAVFQDRLSRGLNRQAIVQRRMQISQLGVRGTPSVFINGRMVASESKTIACLSQMIDEAAAG